MLSPGCQEDFTAKYLLARRSGRMPVQHDDFDIDSGAAHLVLHLVLSSLDPITGLMVVDGQDHTVSFAGWMDLMGAINRLSAPS